jgi:mannose-1-phosphate guanylyltransferase/mannose-6-phosphate isomerase
MERSGRLVVVPAEFDWADVGSWNAVWAVTPARDRSDNVVAGDIVCMDAQNNYIRTSKPTVVIGADRLAIVESDDGLLVATMDRAQDVRHAAQSLSLRTRTQAPRREPAVVRPWGQFATLDRGERFQVKRITVQPGEQLSLQSHRHRDEWWCVVAGKAAVTCGSRVVQLGAGETISIPAGTRHRLANPDAERVLEVIEVQLGGYLGEDDIVRFEDKYGRAADSDAAAPREDDTLAASAAAE